MNTTGSLTPTDEGRVTTGLEYYFGAFGTTVTLDAIIDQVSFHEMSACKPSPPSASCSLLCPKLDQGLFAGCCACSLPAKDPWVSLWDNQP